MPIPNIQQPAPNFKGIAVIDKDFQEISLKDYIGKYVVLFFYTSDFTFVCPTEITAFSDRYDEFININTQLIAASTDSHYSHLAWIETPRQRGGLGNINIPLLADQSCQISRDYGVFNEKQGYALRGLFIIDDKGILRQITINDVQVGRSVDETIRLVQAYQHTDKYGEVCPVGWKPGERTIKPNRRDNKVFFNNNDSS